MNRITEVIYVGDPMCTWCWGIAGELTKFRRKYAQQFKFTLVMGGIRALENSIELDLLKISLENSWKNAAQETGQKFNTEFFNREDFLYDSEPACRAVVTVRDMNSSVVAFDFKENLERHFYELNEDPTDIITYTSIVREMNLDEEVFLEKFNSEEMHKMTLSDFDLADTLDVRGFPTLLVSDGKETKFFCKGFATVSQMELILHEIEKGHIMQIESATCDINKGDC